MGSGSEDEARVCGVSWEAEQGRIDKACVFPGAWNKRGVSGSEKLEYKKWEHAQRGGRVNRSVCVLRAGFLF